MSLEGSSPRELLLRSGSFVVLATLLTSTMGLLPLSEELLPLLPILGLGIAQFTTNARRLPLAIGLAFLTTLLTWPVQALGGPWASIAGFGLGLSAGLLRSGLSQRWSTMNAALAGAALCSLGSWWTGDYTLALPSAIEGPLLSLLLSVVMAPVQLVAATRWKAIARLPSRHHILTALDGIYQEACMRAWDLDSAVRRDAPDPKTREALGEVAAWIYQLSLNLQALDHELAHTSIQSIEQRIRSTTASMEETNDPYTRERKKATLSHLEAMLDHRKALALERERTESMIEYALATLEEARTGLAFARPLSGHTVPESLDGTLFRLRAHAADADIRRKTLRELEVAP